MSFFDDRRPAPGLLVVTVQLGRAAIIDVPTALLAGVAAAVLLRFRPNSTWLVLAGAAAGWGVHAVGLA